MVVLLLLLTNPEPLFDLTHMLFKVVAGATYVQPTRGGRCP